MVERRVATWWLRGPKTPERERFIRFCKDHGWTQDGGSTSSFTSERIFRRNDQKLVAEFLGTSFLTAWLYASEHHRGVMISDIEIVASFIWEPQSWAVEHADEWQSEHEGAIIDRQLGLA